MPIDTKIPESGETRQLDIYYKIPHPSLYEVTYLSADLMELVILSSLIENQNYLLIDDPIFYDEFPFHGGTPYRLSRRVMERYYREYPEVLRLKELKLGSLELTLEAVSAVGAIIIPFVILWASQKFESRTERVISVSTNDPYIKDFL